MAIVYSELKPTDRMTKEQQAEIRRAAGRPLSYDQEFPPLTEEELARMKPVSRKETPAF